jgi:hypothetical protein
MSQLGQNNCSTDAVDQVSLQQNELAGEADVVDGTMILVVGFGFLFAIWAAVIYGSSFFGPK